jgi:hypothetical protein
MAERKTSVCLRWKAGGGSDDRMVWAETLSPFSPNSLAYLRSEIAIIFITDSRSKTTTFHAG